MSLDERVAETPVVVTADELARHVIEPSDFVADGAAFVDVRLPGSAGKNSYSFIGPGVSQNSDQSINLVEPHGFNVGAASMPHGVVNNPHLHFTAEVFICTRGEFEFGVGEHVDQRFRLGEGGVFAAPPWVFRGFTNVGPDDSWVFVVLGGDDTGGILWAPWVLERAADTGLYLRDNWSVIEASEPPADALVPPSAEDLAAVDQYSDAELEQFVAQPGDLGWSSRSLLSSMIGGCEVELAPVIGAGLTQARRHTAPILGTHGFSVEWLRAAPGMSTGRFSIDESQVLLIAEGEWEIGMNEGADRLAARPSSGSVVSIPNGAWREFRNIGDGPAVAAVVCGGDARNRITWSGDIVADAARAGWALDANGSIAPAHLLKSESSS